MSETQEIFGRQAIFDDDHSRRIPGPRGFSVLELMVALAVAAILLTVGVPAFTSTTKNAAIVSSANGFLADLHYARDLAVTRNRRVVVCPSSSSTACDSSNWAEGWMIFVDTNNNGALEAGEPIERTGTSSSKLSLTSLNPAFASAVTYRPNGRAMGQTVTDNSTMFLMCDDRGPTQARAVTIEISGRPRVTQPANMGMNVTCPT